MLYIRSILIIYRVKIKKKKLTGNFYRRRFILTTFISCVSYEGNKLLNYFRIVLLFLLCFSPCNGLQILWNWFQTKISDFSNVNHHQLRIYFRFPRHVLLTHCYAICKLWNCFRTKVINITDENQQLLIYFKKKESVYCFRYNFLLLLVVILYFIAHCQHYGSEFKLKFRIFQIGYPVIWKLFYYYFLCDIFLVITDYKSCGTGFKL